MHLRGRCLPWCLGRRSSTTARRSQFRGNGRAAVASRRQAAVALRRRSRRSAAQGAIKPPSPCAAARHSPIKARPPRLSCVWGAPGCHLVRGRCRLTSSGRPRSIGICRSTGVCFNGSVDGSWSGEGDGARNGGGLRLSRRPTWLLRCSAVALPLPAPSRQALPRFVFFCRLRVRAWSRVARARARVCALWPNDLLLLAERPLWRRGRCDGAGALWRLIGDKIEEVEETRQQAKSREASTTDDRRPMALLIRLHEVNDDCVVHSVCADALVTRTLVMSPRPPLWAG